MCGGCALSIYNLPRNLPEDLKEEIRKACLGFDDSSCNLIVRVKVEEYRCAQKSADSKLSDEKDLCASREGEE